MPLLEIRDLRLDFKVGGRAVRAVDGASLGVGEGETLALVGESGCGKSVTALSVARLLATPPALYAGGQILVQGKDVLAMPPRELRRLRGGVVSYIFQDPAASLNPVMRIGAQILESLRAHRPAFATAGEVARLLKLVGIAEPSARARNYPHELSGGMQQRAMIAMALASEPRLLIADEPTTALDVTIQAQIIELLLELKNRLGMAMLIITHNLGVVGDIADRVAVMYAGQIVEAGPARALLERPLHPYTEALIRSAPQLGRAAGRLEAIPGQPPVPGRWPPGCRFAARCSVARPDCAAQAPALAERGAARLVRCPYAPV